MDKELILRLAAAWPWMTDYNHREHAICEFAALVAEECAKVCERLYTGNPSDGSHACAIVIREKLGNTA